MTQMTLSEYSMHQALLKDNEKLRQCCAQRGARLQVLRESMRETDWLHFCQDNPEADKWFDADGVPVSC
jgi:hypothetical protein